VPCNCAVVSGRVKTRSINKNKNNSDLLWRGTRVKSGVCKAVAILVGGHMQHDEEEASFKNHHIKSNALESSQVIVLVNRANKNTCYDRDDIIFMCSS
jgi:hypothetical protein